MTDRVEAAKKIIDECSVEERLALKAYLRPLAPHPLEKFWGLDADTILHAIERSSDLTKRGVRGIIAEAAFASAVAPSLEKSDWHLVEVPTGLSYDALAESGSKRARIQIKLQRLERGTPKHYYPNHYAVGSLFVVEVQKTRSGEITVKNKTERGDGMTATTVAVTKQTRPYKFGDFDIIAVNLHPSSGNWKDFRFTVASWLLPRPGDQSLIEIFQPVASEPNDVWTENLATCLDWLETGERRSVLTNLLHVKKPKP